MRILKMIETNEYPEVVDQMRKKKIAIGAEGEVYNSKIKFIR